FELRAPLERLEEALGEDGAAPRERHDEEIEARAVEASPSDLAKIEGELATLAAERAARPEDELPVGPEPPLQFAAYAGGDVLVGEAETLAAIALSWGDTPLVAHDWKTLAASEDPCEAPTLEHDTLVAAYLLDPAGRAYPLVELTDREGIGARIEGGDGLAERAVVTRALAARQRDELEREGLTRLFREVELPLVEVLIEMERAGVKLDTARLADISAKVQERIAALEREVWDLAGEEFTIGSPQQLTEVGREIRSCFVAEEGCRLISADYSQVELRVLAHVCGEQVLKDIFARGEDVHAATAGEMFGIPPEKVDPGTRSKAKMINFGIVYGLSAFGLADRLDIPQEEAAEFIERYLARFPKVKEYIETTIAQATADGYVT